MTTKDMRFKRVKPSLKTRGSWVENRRKQEENQEEKRGKKRKPAAHNWELNAADKLGVPTMRKMWERCCCEWFSRTQPSLYVCMYVRPTHIWVLSLFLCLPSVLTASHSLFRSGADGGVYVTWLCGPNKKSSIRNVFPSSSLLMTLNFRHSAGIHRKLCHKNAFLPPKQIPRGLTRQPKKKGS